MKLTEMPNTGVIINTEEELKEYLQICEDGGWKWHDGDLPTSWVCNSVPYYIIAIDKFSHASKNFYTKLITLQQFKEAQNIMKYKQGDVLTYSSGKEKTILGICGKVYLMSYDADQGKYNTGYTETELDKMGLSLKVDTPKQEVIEMTLEEVAEKMGVPVDQIRIKD